MKFEQLIVRRFLQKEQGSFSRSLVPIAVVSITLGVLVMIMSIAILRGFQLEIQQKVVGFGSHIVVSSQYVGSAYEADPISTQRAEVGRLRALPGVGHLQFFAQKGGMIKTNDQIHGIIFKGIDAGYDTTFFSQHLVEGRLFSCGDTVPSNEIIISSTISHKLGLQLNDKVRTYFWQGDSYRARAFQVVGIYNTDLTSFDDHYLVGDLSQVQRLNNWADTLVEGYELLIDDFDQLYQMVEQVTMNCNYDLMIHNIKEQNASTFAWLELLNNNIVLILAVMVLVCIVSIVSALLIMIFEKTSMIGVLKTLGATNSAIRNIFIRKSASIIGRGLLWGNLLAALLCFLQWRFHLVTLDSESYSMQFVPIHFNIWYFVLVSAGTMVCCLVALLLPTGYISKIEPAKTIRLE